MQIAKSTFIVTGGGSGLGAACVRLFAGQGANVVIADIAEGPARALTTELGNRVRFVHTDVIDEAQTEACVRSAQAIFGGVQGLVQCAGLALAETVLGKQGPKPLASFQKVIGVNLVGTFNMLRHAAAVMLANEANSDGERGVIVNTASVAAFDGQIGQAAYAASKGGVVSLTLPLAREFARFGIRVMAVAPGIFDTPLLAGLPEAARQSLALQPPFPQRLGRPDEFAALVGQIVENAMLNGEVIRIDAGLRMAAK